MQCLRAGRGCDGVVRDFLCCVQLIVSFTGLLKDTFRVVLLKPPWLWEREVLLGWSRSSRGSQKVTHLAVFLKPPGVGEVGTLRVSLWECAARFGTLNSQDP